MAPPITETRASKPPNKYDDCYTGDEIEHVLNDLSDLEVYEKPHSHLQANGKTNNVTFKTTRTNTWKEVLTSFFGEEKSSVLPKSTGFVVSIVFDSDNDRNISIKVNIFNTGSVVIQGAKCVLFSDLFFQKMKVMCDDFDDRVVQIRKVSTVPKTVDDSVQGISVDVNTPDITLDENLPGITGDVNTAGIRGLRKARSTEDLFFTPKPPSKNETPQVIVTPREKQAQLLSESLDSKVIEINTVLATMDNTLVTFAEKLGDIQSAMNTVPDSVHKACKDSIENHKRKVLENLESLESKIKHCSATTDSLHVKCNLRDTQIKALTTKHEDLIVKMDTMSFVVEKLSDRIQELDSKVSRVLDSLPEAVGQNYDNADHHNSTVLKIPVSPAKNSRSEVSDTPERQQKMGSSQTPRKQIECDYLILSDSLLQRIMTKRFTPKAKTVKRFIHGGATTCANFKEKNCSSYKPKNVIINVGTRDLQEQEKGVDDNEFSRLLDICTQSWENAKIFLLPIIRRLDFPYEDVQEANRCIRGVCEFYPDVVVIYEFEPSDDMYFNDVHLNNSGLASLVTLLKTTLGISKPSNRGVRSAIRPRLHVKNDGSQHSALGSSQAINRNLASPCSFLPPKDSNTNNPIIPKINTPPPPLPFNPGNTMCPPWFQLQQNPYVNIPNNNPWAWPAPKIWPPACNPQSIAVRN